MMKNLILVTSVVANVIAVWLFLPAVRERIGGRSYDVSEPDDLASLRRLIYQCEPLLQGLEEYNRGHAKYPESLGEVTILQAHYKQDMIDSCLLAYGLNDDRRSFWLYFKLNWDAALRYDSASHRWSYDPGDGGEGTLIQP